MNLKIGVLGGIGPESTSIFYKKLIQKLQEKNLIKNNEDYPQIIINSINAPELIFDKIDDKDLEPYIRGLKELDFLNPDFILMVCNTIHLYHEMLQSKINANLIDLRNEVLYKLQKDKISKITILGTPNTISKGLYKFDDIDYLNPNEEELSKLSSSILEFNSGKNKSKNIQYVKKITDKYLSLGSKNVLLACTEFEVMLEKFDIPKISTINILIDVVIKKIRREKITHL